MTENRSERPGEREAIEAAVQTVADMAFDWDCPVHPNRRRFECRQCVAKIAVAAAYPIIARTIVAAVIARIDAEQLEDSTGDPGDLGYTAALADALNAAEAVAAGVGGADQ